MSNYKAKKVKLEDATLPGEIWRDVPETGNLYKISSLGRIYSSICQRILKLNPHKTYGYTCVPLGKRGERISYRIHRLVAQAFLPNPFNKKEVNHKNKNRSDNRIENLEWHSAWENTQHKYGKSIWHNRQGRISPTHSLSSRKLKGFSEAIIPQIHQMIPLQ